MKKSAVDPVPTPITASSTTYFIASRATPVSARPASFASPNGYPRRCAILATPTKGRLQPGHVGSYSQMTTRVVMVKPAVSCGGHPLRRLKDPSQATMIRACVGKSDIVLHDSTAPTALLARGKRLTRPPGVPSTDARTVWGPFSPPWRLRRPAGDAHSVADGPVHRASSTDCRGILHRGFDALPGLSNSL
jgi:hypothetical protein